MPIYSYGPVAWVWRLLGAGGVAAFVLTAWLAWRHDDAWWLAIGLPLALPVAVLFPMVVVRAWRDGEAVVVETLADWRRRIPLAAMGPVAFRRMAYSEGVALYAPRVWIRVRGGWPLHVDLMGTIPDRRNFLAVFRVAPRDLPGR